MLRELVDTALLEDFLTGLSRSARLRVCAYDIGGRLIADSPPTSRWGRLTGHVPGALSRAPEMLALPADEPPAAIAFHDLNGIWFVFAPVLLHDERAGLVGVGEFRDGELSPQLCEEIALAARSDGPTVRAAWGELPALVRSGEAAPVVTARWAARMLSEWCRRESRVHAAAEELALVGDIAALLTGELDLQTILDRIVAQTARVMKCHYSSLRLYNPETDELTIAAVHNLSGEYRSKRPIQRPLNAIDDEAMRGHMVYIEDARADPRILFPEEARRQGLVSGLTAGMIYRGEPVGVIRVYSNRRQRFRTVQRNLLHAVASQAATAIVHAQLLEQRLQNAQTQRQLELAGDVQSRMIRAADFQHARLETAMVFDPCAPVGGDFCDFLALPDGRVAAVVADVAGKGIPASLLMASVRGALRGGIESGLGLDELITRLNRHACRDTSTSEFITLLIAALDVEAGRLSFVNAGHEPLLVLRDGRLLSHDDGDLVLGVDPEIRYSEKSIELREGDFVLLYTDGAIEASNFAGELFGRERLRASFLQYGGLGVHQALKNIQWDIRRFIGLAERADDLTLVGVRVRPAPGSA